jgi:hypothetical protein
MGIKLNINDISRLLDRSTSELSTKTADGLHAARRAALQHQQIKQPTLVHAWLNEHGIIGHHGSHQHKTLNWGLAALLAVVLIGGIGYWQNASEHDHSELDIAILTDDLPVHMYVD